VSRVAIVTGAARGIGAATVDALVNDGYRVIAVDRCRDIAEVPYALATSADLDAVVAHHGDTVLGLVGDVRSASDMQLAVETATRHFGRLDAVVACAGVVAGGAPILGVDRRRMGRGLVGERAGYPAIDRSRGSDVDRQRQRRARSASWQSRPRPDIRVFTISRPTALRSTPLWDSSAALRWT
jgi:NAD(P)-dependent dehydrogenase (short-subunit alcohol dehydrogenase family)